MTTIFARMLSLFYAGLLTVFALLSGSENANGFKGIFLNMPNVAPWLLVWAAALISWKKAKIDVIRRV